MNCREYFFKQNLFRNLMYVYFKHCESKNIHSTLNKYFVKVVTYSPGYALYEKNNWNIVKLVAVP